MYEFIDAALSWVVLAIAIAIFAVYHAKSKDKGHRERKEAGSTRINEGACLGVAAGIACGTLGIWDLATSIAFGFLIGELIGLCIKKK